MFVFRFFSFVVFLHVFSLLIWVCSAECNQIFDGEKDTEKANIHDSHSDVEENTGFAIVVNGHSLVHCLTSELEHR